VHLKHFFLILSGQKYINDNINFHAYKLKKLNEILPKVAVNQIENVIKNQRKYCGKHD
jgi:hypothetical protein